MVSKCKNLKKSRTVENTAYIDILLNEMPKKDLDGVIVASSKHFEFDSNKKVT